MALPVQAAPVERCACEQAEAVQGVARRDVDARSATPLSPLCDPNPGIAAVACRFDLPAPDRADDRIARDEAR